MFDGHQVLRHEVDLGDQISALLIILLGVDGESALAGGWELKRRGLIRS